jgi:hypothetical protein
MKKSVNINIKNIIAFINYLSFLAILYIGIFENLPADPILLGPIFAIICINIFFIQMAFRNNFIFLKIYVTYFIINYLLRLIVLLYDPNMHLFIGWILDEFNYENLKNTVLILALYHIIAGLFIILLEFLIRPACIFNKNINCEFDGNLFNILNIWFTILSFYWLSYNLIFQLGRTQDIGLLSYLNLFLGFDLVIILIFIYGLINYDVLDQRMKIKFFTSILLFSGASFFAGSRGFLTILTSTTLIYFLVSYKNYSLKITIKRIFIAIFLFLILFITIIAGDVYRHLYRNTDTNISTNVINYYIESNQFEIIKFINWASHRTSRFDYFSMIIVNEDKRYSHTINPINAIKVVVNDLVPGDVFTDQGNKIIPSHMSIPIDYMGLAPEDVSPLHTDIYGMLGTCIANVGFYIGIPFMLMGLFFYRKILGVIYYKVPLRYKNLGCVYVFYLWVECLAMPGFDVFILNNLFLILQFGMFLLFWRIYNFFRFSQ